MDSSNKVLEIFPSSETWGNSINGWEGLSKGKEKPSKTRESGRSTDSVRSYLKAIGRIPMLNHEEEVSEARKVQSYLQLLDSDLEGTNSSENEYIIREGQRAKAHMIQANLRLVVSIAKKYPNRGLDFMDLIQEGNIGLERAVEKFDPSKGYRFSTYAYWWITQGITRGLHNQARTIRLPIHIVEKLNGLKKLQRQLTMEKGRTPTVKELATAANQSSSEIRKLITQSNRPLSLDMKVGQDQETALIEMLEAEQQSPESVMIQRLLQDSLSDLLCEISDQERLVIELRYGLKGEKAGSLVSVGERLNLSGERVRQIEAKAMRKLRKLAAKAQVRDYLEAM